MKYVTDTTGRFRQRPHYEPVELDRECEAIIKKHLKGLHGEIQFPASTDDITKLIENEVDSLDLYADLSEFGEDVEGATEFRRGQKPRVYINKILTGDTRRENRLRTTLTHEYGHVHYHSYLWDVEEPIIIGSNGKFDNRAICKRSTVLDAPHYDWMEWQAGHVCGAILMPVSYVRRAVQDCTIAPTDPSYSAVIISRISEAFQVSKDAARIRLLRLKLLLSVPS